MIRCSRKTEYVDSIVDSDDYHVFGFCKVLPSQQGSIRIPSREPPTIEENKDRFYGFVPVTSRLGPDVECQAIFAFDRVRTSSQNLISLWCLTRKAFERFRRWIGTVVALVCSVNSQQQPRSICTHPCRCLIRRAATVLYGWGESQIASRWLCIWNTQIFDYLSSIWCRMACDGPVRCFDCQPVAMPVTPWLRGCSKYTTRKEPKPSGDEQ